MKRTLKKALCFVLSAVMLLSCMSVVALAAENEKNDVPTILLDGINSSDTINTETGEAVYPPDASDILNGLKGNLTPVISDIIKGDYSSLADPLGDAVLKIFDAITCDENGDPIYPTVADYEWPTKEELKEKYSDDKGYTTVDNIFYSYDWRLDMKTLASQFHDFVEYVLDATGAEKVNVVGFSMGTSVLMTYLKQYDYQYINNIVLLAGAYNGVSCCGEPFAGKIDFDSETLISFCGSMLRGSAGMDIINYVINILYQAGVVDNVITLAKKIVASALDGVYEKAFGTTFARIPGFWSLIPYDIYDEAKALMLSDNVTDAYVEKIDYYHNEIQAHNKDILDGALEKGIQFSIVAKYGSCVTPCVESEKNIADSVIDTRYESFGATCALVNETLGDGYVQKVNDGHNHLSADGIIDASTCAYPEYTWFIKNINHSEHHDCEWEFCDYLLNCKSQPTVWDSAEHSQFLIYIDNSIQPLTAENNYSILGDTTRSDSLIERLKTIFGYLVKIFKSLFSLMKVSK